MDIRINRSRLALNCRPLYAALCICVLGCFAAYAAGAGPSVAAARLAPVQLNGNYFVRDGHPFLVLGAHWVPAKAAMQWPLQWDPGDIEADFAQMSAMGFNTVRLDLMWAWFEPRPGDYNPAAFGQFDYLISLAHKHHLYLHPTLFVGGEVGEAYWDVPWRHGRNPQSDPEMLQFETNQAREFGRRYAHEPAILAWDLTDEPPFWIATGTSDAAAVNWTRLIAGGIRKYDSMHPIVVGVSTQDMDHGPFRPDTIAADVDFLSVHPYTIYTPDLFPDPMVSERSTYGAAFETSLSRGAGKPVMVQEMGASSAQYSPQKITQFDRVSLYSSLGAGANGFLLWCYTDAAPEQYRKVPYLRSPHETQFGLTTWDRKLRPQGIAFQKFEKLAGQMDLSDVAMPAGDAAILIPEEWARSRGDYSRFGLKGPEVIPYVSVTEGGAVNGQTPAPFEGNQRLMSAELSAFILAHRAGLQPAFPRESGDWQSYPLLLLPSPLTSTDSIFVHVHTSFWEQALEYVKRGGVLYASVAGDAAIPEMDSLFGARMSDAAVVTELTLKVVKSLGDLKAGDTFHFNVPGAGAKNWGAGLDISSGEVIAVDQNDHPALVAHALGKGKTLLSAYPIEFWLGNQPVSFENDESVYRLYRALRDWSGVRARVSTDQPSVEASSLEGRNHGYVILANHSAETRKTRIVTAAPLLGLRQLSEGSTVAVSSDADGYHIDLPAYEGAILEWRRR